MTISLSSGPKRRKEKKRPAPLFLLFSAN
jgi:hypothetical protein